MPELQIDNKWEREITKSVFLQMRDGLCSSKLNYVRH
jgi:hypothetical protein